MKTLEKIGYCFIAFGVFNALMFTKTLIIDKGYENEQVTSEIIQPSEVSSTTEETQTVAAVTEYSNESTQEVVAPSVQPQSTEEYTVNNYLGVDTYSNLNADNYSITRNSDGVKGVLIVESPYSMQWFYYDNRSLIYTN